MSDEQAVENSEQNIPEDRRFWCPGCGVCFDSYADSLVFIDGGWSQKICQQCDQSLRPFERILLRLLASPSGFASDDHMYPSLGLVEEFQDFMQGFRKLFRAFHEHDMDGICSSCDPDGYRRRMERKAAMRAAEKKAAQPSAE